MHTSIKREQEPQGLTKATKKIKYRKCSIHNSKRIIQKKDSPTIINK